MKFLILLSLFASVAAFAQEASYKRLERSCSSCREIDRLMDKHNSETSSSNRLDLALKVAQVIKAINLRGESEVERRREIYYALQGTIQVLNDDFDSETVVRLMDLRKQAAADFDYVFWRFPIGQQRDIIGRMKSFKKDNLRPNAKIPEAKEIQD